MNTNVNEIGSNPNLCSKCGKMIVNSVSTGMQCRFCGKGFCPEHQHNLALTYLMGGECAYVCQDCIDEHKLRVVDPNHPYYMKYKGV